MLKFKLKHINPKIILREINYGLVSKKGFKTLLGKILISLNVSDLFTIKRNGYLLKFFPTALSLTLFSDNSEWVDEDNFMAQYLSKYSIIIDIGANVGSIGLKAASVATEGHVYMIEAHPETFGYMLKNIKLNNFKNITTFNLAVGKDKGKVKFSNSSSDDMNSVVVENESYLEVDCDKLDNIIPNTSIDLLKIDVEGFEYEVFLGAQNVIKRTKCIFYESWDQHFVKYGTNSNSVIEFLKDNGFTICKLKNSIISEVNENYYSINCENLIAIKDINDFKKITNYVFA